MCYIWSTLESYVCKSKTVFPQDTATSQIIRHTLDCGLLVILKHCKALQFITALEGAPFTAQIRKSVWFSCQPLPYHPLGPQSRLQL